jgi:hypothetical protein
MIKEHDSVVLTRDIPQHHLEKGDVGTVVHLYGEGAGYEVEFVSASGRTLAVLTLDPADLRPPDGSEILHARKLSPV